VAVRHVLVCHAMHSRPYVMSIPEEHVWLCRCTTELGLDAVWISDTQPHHRCGLFRLQVNMLGGVNVEQMGSFGIMMHLDTREGS